MNTILTPRELGDHLRVSDATIRAMASRGEIPGAFRVGKQWRSDAGVDTKWRHLRHYFVSQCAAARIPMLTTSRWIGHSKYSFTMDRYGFLFDEDEGPALERLHARVTGLSQQ